MSDIKKVTVPINGMHCASCAYSIKKVLDSQDGVLSCDVNFGNEKATIEYDSKKVDLKKLSSSIKPIGYSIADNGINHSESDEHSTHIMPNGEVMHGEMDHSEHLGLNQSKEEKLKELASQRKKLFFVLPATLGIFFLMMWEILSMTVEGFPMFIIPENIFKSLSLIIASIMLFWIGLDFLKEVIVYAKYKVANMYTLIGIGTFVAFVYSSFVYLFSDLAELLSLPESLYFDVTIVVIGFVFVGRYLETKSKLETGEAIQKLIGLQSKDAIFDVENLSEERNLALEKLGYSTSENFEIKIDDVQEGDILHVKPGTKIPLDGEIIEGSTSVDESMITGEPIPVDRLTGDRVIGGTINKQGSVKIKVTKVGSKTLLSQIIKMVDEAQGSRAPIQRLADKISSVFVPSVLVISLITLLVWLTIGTYFLGFDQALSYGILSFVGVLVIACPCALGLATPTAIIVGTGKGAENGILIKNAESLEKLHKVNTIVTDKTGTLTEGKPFLTDIIIQTKTFSQERVLELIGSLESNSEHPLSQAISEEIKKRGIKIEKTESFENMEGMGIKGVVGGVKLFAGNTKLAEENNLNFDQDIINKFSSEGKTPVIFFAQTNSNLELLGYFGISDKLKENINESINILKKMGIEVIMLTGDNEQTAKYIASKAGISKIIAEVMPNEKSEKIKELQSQGKIVAMIGDGINDSPALAQSDVGIAMATGTDIAMDSASITLLKGDFSKVVNSIKLSKFTMRAIKQNLFWAFAYNILGIPLAAGLFFPFFGILLNPIFAGMAMALSSVSVIGNSLRLKLIKLK